MNAAVGIYANQAGVPTLVAPDTAAATAVFAAHQNKLPSVATVGASLVSVASSSAAVVVPASSATKPSLKVVIPQTTAGHSSLVCFCVFCTYYSMMKALSVKLTMVSSVVGSCVDSRPMLLTC